MEAMSDPGPPRPTTPPPGQADLTVDDSSPVAATPPEGTAARPPRLVEHYHDYLRWLYRGGRPNRFARFQNNLSAVVFGLGVWPRRVGALEVVGRRSAKPVSLPVVITEYKDGRYLVSMLGESANWVKNVRAAGGRAVLRHGRREKIRLEEVSVEERPPILAKYLDLAPRARPHLPVARGAPASDFAAFADGIPVFRITADVVEPI